VEFLEKERLEFGKEISQKDDLILKQRDELTALRA
jgi:hypothetical protein